MTDEKIELVLIWMIGIILACVTTVAISVAIAVIKLVVRL